MYAKKIAKPNASTHFWHKQNLILSKICRHLTFQATLCLNPAAAFRCVIFHFEQKGIKFLYCTLGYFSRGEIWLANAYVLFLTDVLSLGFIFATNHLRSVEFCCGELFSKLGYTSHLCILWICYICEKDTLYCTLFLLLVSYLITQQKDTGACLFSLICWFSFFVVYLLFARKQIDCMNQFEAIHICWQLAFSKWVTTSWVDTTV